MVLLSSKYMICLCFLDVRIMSPRIWFLKHFSLFLLQLFIQFDLAAESREVSSSAIKIVCVKVAYASFNLL